MRSVTGGAFVLLVGTALAGFYFRVARQTEFTTSNASTSRQTEVVPGLAPRGEQSAPDTAVPVFRNSNAFQTARVDVVYHGASITRSRIWFTRNGFREEQFREIDRGKSFLTYVRDPRSPLVTWAYAESNGRAAPTTDSVRRVVRQLMERLGEDAVLARYGISRSQIPRRVVQNELPTWLPLPPSNLRSYRVWDAQSGEFLGRASVRLLLALKREGRTNVSPPYESNEREVVIDSASGVCMSDYTMRQIAHGAVPPVREGWEVVRVDWSPRIRADWFQLPPSTMLHVPDVIRYDGLSQSPSVTPVREWLK